MNLDLAAEHFDYSVIADIQAQIEVDDVMKDHSLCSSVPMEDCYFAWSTLPIILIG